MSDPSALLFMALAYGATVFVVVKMMKNRRDSHRPIPAASAPMQRKLMRPIGIPRPPPRDTTVYAGMLGGQHG